MQGVRLILKMLSCRRSFFSSNIFVFTSFLQQCLGYGRPTVHGPLVHTSTILTAVIFKCISHYYQHSQQQRGHQYSQSVYLNTFYVSVAFCLFVYLLSYETS